MTDNLHSRWNSLHTKNQATNSSICFFRFYRLWRLQRGGCPIQSRFLRLSGVGRSLAQWTFRKVVHHGAHSATASILPACHPV